MLKPYLFVFDNSGLDRQQVLDYFDTCSVVKNWYAFMPNTIVVITDQDSHALQEAFSNGFPGRKHIITAIVNGDNNGWLGKKVWDFINDPKST